MLAHGLVEARLAACVNIMPGVTSIYGWQEQVESSVEQLLLIKTAQHLYTEVETFIQTHHPYQVPEVIALPVEQGASAYLNWLGAWVR